MSDVFEELEPPPHGWTRLSARLEERRPARWRWALVTAAAAAVVVLLVPRPHANDFSAEQRRDALALLSGVPLTNEPVSWSGDDPGAVTRVQTQDPSVVMYRVAMLERN